MHVGLRMCSSLHSLTQVCAKQRTANNNFQQRKSLTFCHFILSTYFGQIRYLPNDVSIFKFLLNLSDVPKSRIKHPD